MGESIPRALWGLYAVLFLEIFGAALSIPVFNYFAIEELKLTATYLGIIMACFNAAQFIGAPTVGRISDAVGRRTPLLLAFVWTGLCFAATSCVTTFWELLIVRTLAGLSGGSIPVSQAMIIDVSTTSTRPYLLGLTGAVLGVAFTMGPLTVVVMLHFIDMDRRYIFLMAAFFALVGTVIGWFVLRETLDESKRNPLFEKNAASAGLARHCEFVAIEGRKTCSIPLLFVWAGRFFITFSFLTLFTTYAFLIREAFDWSDREFGLILACAGVSGGVAQLTIYPTLSRSCGKHMVCSWGSLLTSLCFITLPIFSLGMDSRKGHIVSMAIFALGSALVDPGIPDLVGLYAPEDRMGAAQGITTACRSAGSIISPLIAGVAYDASPYYAYYGAACAAAVAAVCFYLAYLAGRGVTYDISAKVDQTDVLLASGAKDKPTNYSA